MNKKNVFYKPNNFFSSLKPGFYDTLPTKDFQIAPLQRSNGYSVGAYTLMPSIKHKKLVDKLVEFANHGYIEGVLFAQEIIPSGLNGFERKFTVAVSHDVHVSSPLRIKGFVAIKDANQVFSGVSKPHVETAIRDYFRGKNIADLSAVNLVAAPCASTCWDLYVKNN